MTPQRFTIGSIAIDSLTFAQAIDAIDSLICQAKGGSVFTPNIDHVVNAEHNSCFRQAYQKASLCLVDGTPLMWASRLLGTPLPEKVSGSDLVIPLLERASQKGWRLFLMGGEAGVAHQAAEKLQQRFPLTIVGIESPRISLAADDPDDSIAMLAKIKEARPDLLLVALGSPKQELWIDRNLNKLRPAVAVAVGAGLDFVAGTVSRAPPWISKLGMEWLYRMAQEPRRLWRRYLVNDPKFLKILWRAWKKN